MCKREMTLGEEIIELAEKGIDMPTIERMYRKYIEMTAEKESKETMKAYCINDVLATKEFVNAVALFGAPAKSDLKDAKIGDKTFMELDGLGIFTAIVHKVTDDKVMLIFDDYVAEKPMNDTDTNNGGFEDSDLNAWLHTEFVKALPYSIRARLTDVTIPTVGEIFGWDDEWDRNHFEADNDKQLPLMKQRCNRVAHYSIELCWLRNATKKEFSSVYFALVRNYDSAICDRASNSHGVRPKIWLVK